MFESRFNDLRLKSDAYGRETKITNFSTKTTAMSPAGRAAELRQLQASSNARHAVGSAGEAPGKVQRMQSAGTGIHTRFDANGADVQHASEISSNLNTRVRPVPTASIRSAQKAATTSNSAAGRTRRSAAANVADDAEQEVYYLPNGRLNRGAKAKRYDDNFSSDEDTVQVVASADAPAGKQTRRSSSRLQGQKTRESDTEGSPVQEIREPRRPDGTMYVNSSRFDTRHA